MITGSTRNPERAPNSSTAGPVCPRRCVRAVDRPHPQCRTHGGNRPTITTNLPSRIPALYNPNSRPMVCLAQAYLPAEGGSLVARPSLVARHISVPLPGNTAEREKQCSSHIELGVLIVCFSEKKIGIKRGWMYQRERLSPRRARHISAVDRLYPRCGTCGGIDPTTQPRPPPTNLRLARRSRTICQPKGAGRTYLPSMTSPPDHAFHPRRATNPGSVRWPAVVSFARLGTSWP